MCYGFEYPKLYLLMGVLAIIFIIAGLYFFFKIGDCQSDQEKKSKIMQKYLICGLLATILGAIVIIGGTCPNSL